MPEKKRAKKCTKYERERERGGGEKDRERAWLKHKGLTFIIH
jgi:hypothetical protein